MSQPVGNETKVRKSVLKAELLLLLVSIITSDELVALVFR